MPTFRASNRLSQISCVIRRSTPAFLFISSRGCLEKTDQLCGMHDAVGGHGSGKAVQAYGANLKSEAEEISQRNCPKR
jgi:hypothetical protein